MNTIDKFNKEDTLCWYCANSVPNPDTGKGCNWSMNYKTVKGWDAVETTIITRQEKDEGVCSTRSFFVKGCPCFDRDSYPVNTSAQARLNKCKLA